MPSVLTRLSGAFRTQGGEDPLATYSKLATQEPSAQADQMYMKAPAADIRQFAHAYEDPESLTFHNDGTNLMLFASEHWFVREADKKIIIQVMRIGDPKSVCSVNYKTRDGSADAGVRYEARRGILEFGEGEIMQSFEVPIIESSLFDTEVCFFIELSKPKRGRLDPRLSICHIFILDKDTFPTNKYAKEIHEGDEAELDKVGLSIVLEFAKYTYRKVPKVWWKSLMVGILQQLQNVYYFFGIVMRVYLVDVILNVHDESTQERLLIKGDRPMSAVALAVAWFTPNLILLAISVYVQSILDMGYAIRKYLRVNLFRKMLHFNEKSRRAVPVQEMTDAVSSLIPDVTSAAYLGIFDMLTDAGKIVCIAFFMLSRHPTSALGFILFPTAMAVTLKYRQKKSLELEEKADDAEDTSEALVAVGCLDYGVISRYHQKNWTVHKYEELLGSQRALTMEVKMFDFWSDELVPWLTLIVVTLYMLVGSLEVLHGHISVGTFLATINVYKDLGDRFGGVYDRLNKFKGAVKPMLDLTHMMNLPGSLQEKEVLMRKRLKYTTDALARSPTQKSWNRVPIKFVNACFHTHLSVRTINMSIMPGSITLIHGPEGCCKERILKAVSDMVYPDKGDVLYAPHQITLHVRFEPEIIGWMSLLENLRFGTGSTQGSPARVREIFGRVGISSDHWLMKRLNKDIKGDDSDDHDVPWHERASHVEKKMIHLARAFIFDPQIMCLHKPVDDLDSSIGSNILSLLTEFVNNGHLQARVRTVFLSTGSKHIGKTLQNWCDYAVDLGHTQAESDYEPRIRCPDYDVHRHTVEGIRLHKQKNAMHHYTTAYEQVQHDTEFQPDEKSYIISNCAWRQPSR